MTHERTADLRAEWGRRIRAARIERGHTVVGLARLAGVDPGGISRIERGTQGAGDDTRVRIAGALQLRANELFAYPDSEDLCPSSAANAAAEAPSRPSATTPTTPRARTRPGGRHPARSAKAAAPSADEDGPHGTEGGA